MLQLAAVGHVVGAARRDAAGVNASGVGGTGISLVQGPPGTGKSTTLLAMVGLLLHSGGTCLSPQPKPFQRCDPSTAHCAPTQQLVLRLVAFLGRPQRV